jgi:hypothetical protein
MVTDQELEKCYIIISKIITKYGEVYLPIFERIHNERQLRAKKQDMLSIALSVVNSEKQKRIQHKTVTHNIDTL